MYLRKITASTDGRYQYSSCYGANSIPKQKRCLSAAFLCFFGFSVFNEFFGADGGAQAAGIAFGVVDDGQVLLDPNRLVGADLGTQAAAHAALGAATDRHRTLGVRSAGHHHMMVIGNGGDDAPGAGCGAAHTARTFIGVYLRHAVLDFDGAVLAGLDAGAEA